MASAAPCLKGTVRRRDGRRALDHGRLHPRGSGARIFTHDAVCDPAESARRHGPCTLVTSLVIAPFSTDHFAGPRRERRGGASAPLRPRPSGPEGAPLHTIEKRLRAAPPARRGGLVVPSAYRCRSRESPARPRSGAAGRRRSPAAALRVRTRIGLPAWVSRRPPGKARGARIPGVCKRRATQPGGMHRRPRWRLYSRSSP